VSLQVQIAGRTYEAQQAVVERSIGEPVTWTFSVPVAADVDSTTDAQNLARALAGGNTYLSASCQGSGLVDSALVVGARWRRSGTHLLELSAHTTAPKDRADVFRPRRRVHRVKNWRELVDAFEPVVTVATGVRNHLETKTFPHGEHTSIVQDGLSDWEFLGNIVEQFSRVETDPALARLTVVGGNVKGSTAGRWILNWASGEGYEHFQDVQPRQVDRSQFGVNHARVHFGDMRHVGAYRREFPTARVPLGGEIWADRRFEHNAWEAWINRDAPLFVGPGDRPEFAWRVRDSLRDSGQPGVVNWATELTTGPMALFLDNPLPHAATGPWVGFGVVKSSDAREPWLEVRLNDFERDAAVVEARVTTGYGGLDNTKGLHFVPEVDTPVVLAGSGRLTDPLVVLANVREQAATFGSPSIFLESTFTTQYESIACKSVGPISVGSDLKMAVERATQVKSSKPMTLTADKCDVELRSGVFYTGKGV
jgi:hypothetical protein